MNASVCYESETQLILFVVLDDGRRLSIDLQAPLLSKRLKDVQSSQTILVSGRIQGLALD